MFWPVVINDMIWWTMYVWRSWLKNKYRTRSKNTTGRIDFQKREKGKVNFNAWPDLHHEKACETKKWETKKIFVNRPNFFILPQAIATSECWKPTANVPATYPCWQLRPKSQDETMTKLKSRKTCALGLHLQLPFWKHYWYYLNILNILELYFSGRYTYLRSYSRRPSTLQWAIWTLALQSYMM